MTPLRVWIGILVLNAALAFAFRTGVPDQPLRSDREEYEFVGQHGFAPGCPMTVYCYRVMVPMLLDQLPLSSDVRWRAYEFLANSLAGFVLALAVARVVSGWRGPLLATWLAQTTFAFTFTAYDPYTADPMVFLIAAGLALAWLSDWPLVAFGLAVIGVFAKETVALVATAAALAALVDRTTVRWRPWVLQAVAAWAVLLTFHWGMDAYAGWGLGRNPAAQFASGSWLWIWLSHLDGARRAAFLLFVPFGFGWLYAVAGFRVAPGPLRALALGAILPILALIYVQTPERALGNAFFVMIPLAVVFLARLPLAYSVPAALTNGLLTAKVGLSAASLPSATLLLIPAAVFAAVALWMGLRPRAPAVGDQPT